MARSSDDDSAPFLPTRLQVHFRLQRPLEETRRGESFLACLLHLQTSTAQNVVKGHKTAAIIPMTAVLFPHIVSLTCGEYFTTLSTGMEKATNQTQVSRFETSTTFVSSITLRNVKNVHSHARRSLNVQRKKRSTNEAWRRLRS